MAMNAGRAGSQTLAGEQRNPFYYDLTEMGITGRNSIAYALSRRKPIHLILALRQTAPQTRWKKRFGGRLASAGAQFSQRR